MYCLGSNREYIDIRGYNYSLALKSKILSIRYYFSSRNRHLNYLRRLNAAFENQWRQQSVCQVQTLYCVGRAISRAERCKDSTFPLKESRFLTMQIPLPRDRLPQPQYWRRFIIAGNCNSQQSCPVNSMGVGRKANSGEAFRVTSGVSDLNRKWPFALPFRV